MNNISRTFVLPIAKGDFMTAFLQKKKDLQIVGLFFDSIAGHRVVNFRAFWSQRLWFVLTAPRLIIIAEARNNVK